ncbi:MAG: S9 family peptidase [Candidatus Zixiibacteriota bacterium]
MRRWTMLVLMLLVAAVMLASPAAAEKLTIDRIYGDTSLSGPTPRGVRISPDGKRVGFLRGRDTDQYQLDLWVYEIDKHKTRMLVDSKMIVPEEKLSDAEKARRERARTASLKGILTYAWSPDGAKLLFPLGDTLYLYDLRAKPDAAVRKFATGEGAIDPKISPKGHYASFVRDQNLYVVDLATGAQRQLTTDGAGTLHNAEAEFVAQEEMDQSSGYWWARNDSLIAFKQYDESPVPSVKRFEVYPDRTEVIEQRYPAAGDSNVIVRLGLIRPTGGDVRWIDLGSDPDIYLARVDWVPDGKTVTYQRESRDQKRLELIAVDVATLSQRTLLTETSQTWINLNDDLRFLKKQPAFIWASERTGFNHLYLYSLDGALIHPLTAGDWNVDGLLAVDEPAGRVYLSSNRDAIIDHQIYTVRLDGSNAHDPSRISQGDGIHGASFARDAARVSLYVEGYSNPLTPPQASIRAADGRFLAWIEENRLDEKHPYWRYRDMHVTPEFGTLTAEDGQTLEYRLLKPPDFDPARRYPVFINVYGGPGSQTVSRGWGDLFGQYMAQQGFIVFGLDNRGSGRRGRRFSDPIYGRLGDVEVRDQLVGVRWLKQQPFVDVARIGVFGWSYGGYMTLMMLAKAGGDLAAGVAVAPVSEWQLYDTHYTERYLGTPQENAAGYDSSAVFGSLANIKAPLLLVHGMADDNVLFTNSTQVMAALQKQGQQFRLMTYPGGKHGLSTTTMRKHVRHLIADFFVEMLKPGDAGK